MQSIMGYSISLLSPHTREEKKHLDVVGIKPTTLRSIHYTMVSRAWSIKTTFRLGRNLVDLMRGSYGTW